MMCLLWPLVAIERAELRRQVEEAINAHLASKYSTRWSAGVSNEAAPLLSSWDWRRERSTSLHNLVAPDLENAQADAAPGTKTPGQSACSNDSCVFCRQATAR